MASKSLSVREEAYRRLKSFKGEGESFSDVIMKVTEGEKDFRKGFGSWRDRKGVEKVIEEGRDRLDQDLREGE
ncbi:MAG: antitoxin VapB family protein [Candidatus Nanohalobium sp.]